MIKNVVFIGDSMTSGENNNFKSFVHYYNEMNPDKGVAILGVSGSCFGDYSIYPVKENLFSMIDNNQEVLSRADLIVIEFGTNDAAAVSLGYVDQLKVYISINRAVDYIKQISHANLLFILSMDINHSLSTDCLFKYQNYLNYEYFLDGISCNLVELQSAYSHIQFFIERNFEVFFMNESLFNNYDKDNIHPNDKGYREFAERLTKYINEY